MTDRETKKRVNPSDLSTRALRALVPASLALGIIVLYPPISHQVVRQFGAGFQPRLVAIYVITLVGLFLLDAWARDRRMSRMRTRAARAELRAERQHQRAEELRFVLDVASELNGRDRIESSLFRVLGRLHDEIPFDNGHVFLRDVSGNALVRRGIWPLTSRPSERSQRLAEQTVDIETYDNNNPVALFGPNDRPDAIACAIRFQDHVIGVLILEGIRTLREHDQPRMLALADRLGASLNGVRLLSAVEARERMLRHAYQELRLSGRRLAQSAAIEQASVIGRAARRSMEGPIQQAQSELSRLQRAVPPADRTPAFKRGMEALASHLERLRDCSEDLDHMTRHTGEPDEIAVNDALVAAIDLAAPDFKRSGIDLRLSLDREVSVVRMDEGILVHFLTRMLRHVRSTLRGSPGPRWVAVETQPYGEEGVKLVVRQSGAGLDRESLSRMLPAPRSDADRRSPLRVALHDEQREIFPGDMLAHGVTIRTEDEIGSGRTWIVCLTGVRSESLL